MAEKKGAVTPLTPNQEHCCEICGVTGLSDDSMREHTKACHVDGSALCPFCGLSGVAPAELLLHVNQAHLDYLTPENELMSFIDDQSPSVDGDSDSLSECRALSPLKSPTTHDISFKLNGSAHSFAAQQHQSSTSCGRYDKIHQNSNGRVYRRNNNGVVFFDSYGLETVNDKKHQSSTTSSSSSSSNQLINGSSHNNHQYIGSSSYSSKSNHDHSHNSFCDTNGIKEYTNGVDTPNGSQGSPLRSQLGLKLKKSNAPATTTLITTTTPKKSPNMCQCPLCPYSSDSPSVLEEHINRSHFDPLSPSVNSASLHTSAGGGGVHVDTLNAFACPICGRAFESAPDLELHVNIEHRDILSPAKVDLTDTTAYTASAAATTAASAKNCSIRLCPVCGTSLDHFQTQEMELHIEGHFAKSPQKIQGESDIEKQAQKLREQREFEMLRAQYGMDDQGNFREQSAAAMQRAVYAGEMSVADYYERQVGLRAAESHGIDDNTSCTKSVAPRVLSLSASSPGVIRTFVCSGVDHYASSYGDKGWGCGYRNLQMMLSSLLQNTTYNEALYSAWGTQGPSRTAMPSISRLQKMVEAAWAQGFDVQGCEQLGGKLHNTRKWIGATEIVTVLSWLRINCQLVDFHRPTASDGRHPELFNWVLKYFDDHKQHSPPLYLQHQGHSRTIIGIEQRTSGLTLLVLDPSHGPRQVAALGTSHDSLRLIRRSMAAMKAPQYQIVAVRGLIETEEQYQASKVLRSLKIPPDC